ncbi:hypothetical protein POM88_002629 [Heracleum sosnowskyi]|uniref:Uncharacterized protein n=1 Tax=Heracleum sosnowskyi TaxID=360622 RepID=A0AAD8NAN5_9APIA|nr:hypothetical protein POM88_002629 [Heracleum sosnowskyi]
MEQHHSISCPQFLNLNIRIRCTDSLYGDIKVLAPKLRNFTSLGIVSVTFVVPEVETANIKLCGWFGDMDCIYRKKYYRLFTDMLSALGNVKNLTFDLDGIEALSATHFLASLPCPFYNLKIVKLPLGYKESSILVLFEATYLAVLQEPALSQHFLRNSAVDGVRVRDIGAPVEEIGKDRVSSFVENRDFGLWRGHAVNPEFNTIPHTEEHVVKDSSVNADRGKDVHAPVGEMGKDPVSSSVGNRDFGLWRGHKVNSEFVYLLDRIMLKYPETFENFTKNNKKLCTVNLNMFCTSVNDFTKISMTEVDSEMLVEYKDAFAYLQNKGFNVSWVVSRLDYIEHLRFSNPLIPELYLIDCRINDDKSKLQELQACVNHAKSKLENLQARVDDANSKLQDVQTRRAEKLRAIEKAFGTMGTKLAFGFIGDDLLSSP